MNKKYFYNNISIEVEKFGYNRDKIEYILKTVGHKKTVLDIGCSDGYIGSLLLKNRNNVYGIDISPKKVTAAKALGVKARLVDIEKQILPYKEHTFDVVLLTDVIEHVFDTDELLERIKRILKVNGTLLITTPNTASLGRRLLLFLGKNPFLEYSTQNFPGCIPPVGHIRYYITSTLQEQLIRHGFKNVRIIGDRVNFGIVSSKTAALIFPNFSVDLLCTCEK